MSHPSLKALLPLAIEIVERAGDLLKAEWSRPGGRRGVGDKAAIDEEIEIVLRRDLVQLLACDFWGEETGHILTGNAWCWVVDPNDGTSDFLKGIKGSAVSVGLLHDNLPVLGIVHAPVTDHGLPDTIAWAEGWPDLLRNGILRSTDLSHQTMTADGIVMVSAAAACMPKINSELCSPASFHPMPSIAYRLARVAAGDGVCGISLYPVAAHDVVAGHALLLGARGVLLDERGRSIEYRTEAGMLNVCLRCFGGAPSACRDLLNRDWNKVFDSTAC